LGTLASRGLFVCSQQVTRLLKWISVYFLDSKFGQLRLNEERSLRAFNSAPRSDRRCIIECIILISE
jgi:hypothetical protein